MANTLKNIDLTETKQNYGPLYACVAKIPVAKSIDTTKKMGDQARAAFMIGKEWKIGTKIKIAFMKDDFINNKITLKPLYEKSKADFVQKIITDKLLPLIDLTFEWDVNIKESDVRISFVPSLGAFSELGINCLKISKDQPTMNLGWLDDDATYSNPLLKGTGIVILHEFGHLLGMIHEHSREDANLDWNKDFVYKQLGAPPNSWSTKDCDEQIFEMVKKQSFNGSKYDKKSVMHYYFPTEYFKTSPNLPTVIELSELDKLWIKKKYSKKSEKIPLYAKIIIVVFIISICTGLYFVFRRRA